MARFNIPFQIILLLAMMVIKVDNQYTALTHVRYGYFIIAFNSSPPGENGRHFTMVFSIQYYESKMLSLG